MRRHGNTDILSNDNEPVSPLTRVVLPIILGIAIMALAGMMSYRIAQSRIENNRMQNEELSRQFIKDCLRHIRRSDYEKAEALVNQAIALTPKSATAYLFRAEARAGLLSTEKLVEAEQDYSQCLTLEPTEFLAYYGRGQIRYRLGKTEDAEIDFSEAIRLKPHYAAAYLARSMARKRLGKQKEAQEDLDHARRLGITSDVPMPTPQS